MGKREEKATFYIVVRREDGGCPDTKSMRDGQMLTIVTSIKEAEEYIEAKVLHDSLPHLSQWYELREGKPLEDPMSLLEGKGNKALWEEYKAEIAEPQTYEVVRIRLQTKYLAALLRMDYGCQPLGCSYEITAEMAEYITQSNA